MTSLVLGVVLALLILASFAAAAVLVGRRRFRARVGLEVTELLGRGGASPAPGRLEARRAALPRPIRGHLQSTLGEGLPVTRAIHLRHGGEIRQRPGQGWSPIRGEEHLTVFEPGFVWRGVMPLAPLVWVEVRDRLLGAAGSLLVKLDSTITLADASGPEVDQGTALRWLAELVWCPVGFLGDRIRWEAAGARSARATFVHDGLPVVALFEVDDEGRIACIRGDRYREDRGDFVLTPWRAACGSYREFSGVRVPARVEITWTLPEGDFECIRLNVTEVERIG